MSDRELILVIAVCMFACLMMLGLLVVFARRRGSATLAPSVADDRLNAAVSTAVDLRFTKIESRMTETEHHLNQVRMQISALPTKDQVHKLDLKITEVVGEMKAVTASTEVTGRIVARIDEHLRYGAAKDEP